MCSVSAGSIMEVQPGTRKRTWFVHRGDGYHYHKNVVRGNKMYLKCINYEGRIKCHGRAVLLRGGELEHTKAHTCHRNRLYPQVQALRRSILERCRRLEYVSFRRIVAEEGRRFPREVRMELPAARIRSAMRNARMSMYPPVPHTLEELTQILANPINRVITMTLDGEENIFAGETVAADGSRHMLFTSPRLLFYARRALTLHSDGTFRTVPRIAGLYQVFIIVTTWRFQIIPLIWVLMERKSQSAYCAVLTVVHRLLGPNAQVIKVITDYEPAMQNAWQIVFPGIVVQGCLWHLDRAYVMYAVVELNLRNWMEVPVVNEVLKLCCAIPLLPENLMERGLVLIARHTEAQGIFFYNLLLPFFVYVWRKWITHRIRQHTMSVFRSHERTNNACESSNRTLGEEMGVAHPNIYNFLSGVLSLEDAAYQRVFSLERGVRVARPRKAVSVVLDERLQNLAEDLEANYPFRPLNDRIWAYLRRARHILSNTVDDFIEQF